MLFCSSAASLPWDALPDDPRVEETAFGESIQHYPNAFAGGVHFEYCCVVVVGAQALYESQPMMVANPRATNLLAENDIALFLDHFLGAQTFM